MVILAIWLVLRWRRRRAAVDGSGSGDGDGDEVPLDILRVRVTKPQEAAAVMRAVGAPVALVTTPWRPTHRG